MIKRLRLTAGGETLIFPFSSFICYVVSTFPSGCSWEKSGGKRGRKGKEQEDREVMVLCEPGRF